MEVVASNSSHEVDARTWLNAHKAETGKSWPQLGALADVNGNTISTFASGKYGGDNASIATKVLAYRDRIAVQSELAADLPMVPAWYDTPTAQRITQMLKWAQSGKMVMVVGGPGIGKTKAAQRFAAGDPNVWLATMSPSTAGVATMLIEMGSAIGLGEIKGSPQQLSRQIRARIANRSGLIIIDEAQELTDKALNELRGLHDATGVGIALFGNEKVVGQLDSRKSALAQVTSRISLPMIQPGALAGDIDALLDAWGIEDVGQRSFLTRLGNLPGALREMTHTIEVALMAAFSADQALSITHLRDAARQRNVKVVGL